LADSLQKKLDEVLAGNPQAIIQQQRNAFGDRIKGREGRYVLCGSGRLGRIAIEGLRKAGVEPLAYADNNPKTWGSTVEGLPVMSPKDAAAKFADNAVFVTSVYTAAPLHRQLTDMGLLVVSYPSLAWTFSDALLPHGALDLPNQIFAEADSVRQAFSLWADDASREEYLGQLLWRTSLDPGTLPPHLPANEIYFPADLVQITDREAFVDCGAFDGDSVRDFVARSGGRFGSIVALEPDPVNCKKLQEYMAAQPREIRDKMRAVHAAAGSVWQLVNFNVTGTAGSAVGSGDFEVECIPLDKLFEDTPPSYIKMDIEGAELDALQGAKRIMHDHHPVLAICLYHRQDDLWKIPLFIHSVAEDYRLFLRRYSDDCWEQVLYAIPNDRLIKAV
jgi:FkbM family methyltransferase